MMPTHIVIIVAVAIFFVAILSLLVCWLSRRCRSRCRCCCCASSEAQGNAERDTPLAEVVVSEDNDEVDQAEQNSPQEETGQLALKDMDALLQWYRSQHAFASSKHTEYLKLFNACMAEYHTTQDPEVRNRISQMMPHYQKTLKDSEEGVAGLQKSIEHTLELRKNKVSAEPKANPRQSSKGENALCEELNGASGHANAQNPDPNHGHVSQEAILKSAVGSAPVPEQASGESNLGGLDEICTSKLKEESATLIKAVPSQAEAVPSEAETAPSKPEAAPSKPEAAPSKPEAAPSKPEAAPSKPEAAPSKPEAAPSKPEAAPSKPEAAASKPEAVPMEENARFSMPPLPVTAIPFHNGTGIRHAGVAPPDVASSFESEQGFEAASAWNAMEAALSAQQNLQRVNLTSTHSVTPQSTFLMSPMMSSALDAGTPAQQFLAMQMAMNGEQNFPLAMADSFVNPTSFPP